jgi:hypothetical protein
MSTRLGHTLRFCPSHPLRYYSSTKVFPTNRAQDGIRAHLADESSNAQFASDSPPKRSQHAAKSLKMSRAMCKLVQLGGSVKIGSGSARTFSKLFASASFAVTVRPRKLTFARQFQGISHIHRFFMLAMLDLNRSHNPLYDSTLRNAMNWIDELSRKSMIELPNRSMLVSDRALDTIYCG